MSIGSHPSNGNPSAASQGVPKLTIKVGDTKFKVGAEDLCNDEFVDDLKRDLSSAQEPPKVFLNNLADLDDEGRWLVLDFLAGCPGMRFVVAKVAHDNLFDAVIADVAKDADVRRECRRKLAVIEVIVLQFADAADLPCGRLKERMEAVGYKGVKLQDLVRDVRRIEKKLASGTEAAITNNQPNVRAVLDAPVSEDAVVPGGWQMTDSCLYDADGAPVASAPIVVVERGQDMDRGTEVITIAWKYDGGWRSRTVPRNILASTRDIVGLSAYGLPVTSNNAKAIVQFIDDYLAANLAHLPSVCISSRMGWQGNEGEQGFLWGRRLITEAGIDPADVSGAIRFAGSSTGDDELADGLDCGGSLKGWLTAVDVLRHFPRVRFGLYASFVPPLLRIFQTVNFIIDFAGPSTTGKTTCLRVPASVWGCPDENRAGTLKTWHSTAVWRERAPAVLNHIPLVLDDTKLVKDPDEVAKTIYAITQGSGKGRGNVLGLANQSHFQTILFSSGEQPAISFTKDGGTRARVLTIWGSPFGRTDKRTRTTVCTLTKRLCSHYGHAGPAFVSHLLRNRAGWEGWRSVFQERQQHYEQQAGNNAVAGRMAPYFAAIFVASKLAHEALDLPWEWSDPIEPLWHELVSEAGEADRGAAAMRYVASWAFSNRLKFYQLAYRKLPESKSVHPPHDGWVGRWDYYGIKVPIPESQPSRWPFIAFYPHQLAKILCEGGFEPDSTIRTWHGRGWLDVDTEASGEQRFQKKVKDESGVPRMIVITREAIDQNYSG